ncbi:MAG: rhodanese-like domain-containing protein [Planctomycetaceae bacterium]
MNVATINPKQLYDIIEKGERIDLVDVRTPVEFREVHVSFARNVPLDGLDPAVIRETHGDENRPLYVICRSGSRGKKACEKMLASGMNHIVNVEGGTLAWEQAGLPVTRGKKTISLERQVRIVAGFLVLLGTTLGAFIHVYWLGLAAFVGAGLMFAGMTDTCGMGMILARMPWNQVREPVEGSAKSSATQHCDTKS